jgi:hypothetical protein
MKKRVTLTMDPDVVRRAKRLAHRRNTSVSALVEDFVRKAALTDEDPGTSFVEKWAGKFRVRTDSRPDPKLAALRARYRLDRQ